MSRVIADGLSVKAQADLNLSDELFTNALKNKLDAIEANATTDQTNSEIKSAYEANADTNEFSDAEETKLANTYTETEVDSLLDDKAAIAGQVFTGEIIYYGAGGISTNSSYGSQSLQSNTTGSLNTALGRSALRENTEGGANTAIGRSSNILNETGSGNTTVGADSLRDNVSGDANTVVGKTSGRGITTGSGNSILGANVLGLASNLTNNLILSSGGVTRLQHDGVGTTAVQGDLVADGILFGTDTAAANTLDDYEEGTWTPEFRGSATAGTYSYAVRVGKYVKTGASVTVWVTMFNIIESVSGAGDIQISGLPYAVSTDLSRGAIGAVVLEDFTFSGSISAVAESSGTILEFRESSTGSGDAVLQVSSRDGDGSDLFTCVTYTTDS